MKAVALVVFSTLPVVQFEGDAIHLAPEQAKVCAEATCALITQEQLAWQLEQAFKAGALKTAKQCRNLL